MEQADSDDNDTLDRHKRAKEELKKATKEKKNQELFNLIKRKVDVTYLINTLHFIMLASCFECRPNSLFDA